MTTTDPTLRQYTLHSPLFSEAPLVAELSLLTAVADALAYDRIDRLVDLFVSGRIVTLSPFQRVTVVEDSLTAVRVLAADGSGRSGWVPSAWLHAAYGESPSRPTSHLASRKGAA